MVDKKDLVIIDDDPIIIKLILKELAPYDLKCETFSDPLLGFDYIIKNPPKIIFLDYSMPMINGREFIIKLSQNNIFQHSTIYLITALKMDPLQEISLKTLGFTGIIKKPFTKEQILQALGLNKLT